jgi:DNA-binding IclR family transcriptional regulator
MQGMRSGEWDQRSNSVLGRAVRLLAAFDVDHPQLTLAELARRSGLPKSTAHRMVGELAEHRLLEVDPDGVRLGMRLFELGQLAPRERSLRETARPLMEDLREVTGATVHLAVLEGVEVVYLEILRGKGAPSMPSRIGGRMPAHATGVGKAILAFSPPEVVTARIDAGLAALSRHTIVQPGRLMRELGRIQAQGVAFDVEESGLGVVCAAAPVFGHGGGVVGALSVTGRAGRLDAARQAPAVRTAALALSRQLRRPAPPPER